MLCRFTKHENQQETQDANSCFALPLTPQCQSYGSEVWYVGDLSDIATIPATVGRYGLSGWTLFGPGVPGVPDGGTTAMLLCAALSVLGVARRYITS